MSKHKPALPERLYYRLADAAQFLGCSTDDLLHYGACGYIEILASSDFWAKSDLFCAAGTVFDSEKGGVAFSTKPFYRFDFFALTRLALRSLERIGEAETSLANELYFSTGKTFKRAFPKAGGKVSLETDNTSDLPGDYFYWNFIERPWDVELGVCSNGNLRVVGLVFDRNNPFCNLWVRTEELRRFQKEGSSHVRVDPPTPEIQEKPIGQTERNNTLAIIAALCKEAGIDVNAHGAVAAVARLTELLGAAVSADTVGRRLKEIPVALESFKT